MTTLNPKNNEHIHGLIAVAVIFAFILLLLALSPIKAHGQCFANPSGGNYLTVEQYEADMSHYAAKLQEQGIQLEARQQTIEEQTSKLDEIKAGLKDLAKDRLGVSETTSDSTSEPTSEPAPGQSWRDWALAALTAGLGLTGWKAFLVGKAANAAIDRVK